METTNFEFGKLSPRVDRGDSYIYIKSSEGSDPDFAYTARQIHARSYKGEGFINDGAIDANGQVASDIDKSRGDNVEYYMGYTTEGEPVSTLRVISVPKEGVTALPGFKLSEAILSKEGKQTLLEADLKGRPVKEISSFGHIPEVSSVAGLELLRNVFQQAYGTDELWFFAMVSEKYQTLVNIFGSKAVRKIGSEVELNDERVGDVELVPALVDTTTFFDDIKEAILSEKYPARRRKLINYMHLFAEGIDISKFSEDVALLLKGDTDFSITTYAEQKDALATPVEWSQPQQFDFTDQLDRLRAKQLVDGARARTVINPDWHEEFPDIAGVSDSERSGSWFYYPWSESLIHFPDEAAYREMRHARDRHLVTTEEQAELKDKSALYAGLSVGSHVVEHMVYAGIGRSHILADFDRVSVSNLNRIHSGMPQVGERKVDVIAKAVSELDPYMQQTLWAEGVTKDALEGLKRPPSIIFDEVDDLAAKALLRLYAKENRVPLIMATDVGYKSVIDIERHDIESVQPFNGRLSQDLIEAMLAGELSPKQRMKVTTKIIGLSNASFRLLQSVSDKTLRGLPQLEVTASQGGALATIVARDILLGRKVSSGRRVHDARRAMKLPAEMPLADGIKVLKNFIANN